ncbi:Signal transduction histidine kinase [Streptomyces sp. 3213]|uniref:HAMP domain-containing sensor histidine kinase n=1 Tax=Streptomyces sp. 3213.3 TaxID=1855348 RepID=UPI000899D4D6|nr:HAMP domain-containing sensor histidine kinase [Streptomyces sp. 3213.3]SED89526.1 Signal transduction histidine kinase [Streptomyces sp. 3213] [Streptomyces sp. 3213.3]
MIRQLIVSYVLLVAVALTAFTVPVAFTLTAQLRGDTEQSVRREAKTMALLLSGDAASRAALDRMVVAYAQETPGTAEVLPASRAKTATHWGGGKLEVTAPAQRDGRTVGAVRITYPTSDLTRRLWQIWGFRAILALAVLAVAAGLGALVARRLTRPLRQLNDMASKFSDGDLTARTPVTGPHETQTLARTLNQAGERLDTLIASQRIFVADASHQLRTPLTALRLSLDNIADGVDDEFVREDVDQATAEVVRMSRLVNGLLVLARAEAKVTAAEPLPLREIVAERLSVWRPAADERGVHIALRGSVVDGRPLVLASPGHLEQVLDNVLSNALEVSPDGATITVRSAFRGDEVELTVTDEGPGMSDADKSRAFDRFWRGQGLTGRTGSGLGLAVVRQLVTDDGGTVTLRDAAGGGLVVAITLRASPRSGG